MTPVSTLSDFNVEVVRVGEVSRHPNADNLSVTTALGNPVVFKTGDFSPGDLAVYIPVDAVVPLDNPAFGFLKNPRIKAVRLRGVYSQGLLVPAPPNAAEGQNVQGLLGITKHLSEFDKKEANAASFAARAPKRKHPMPTYGLDSLKRMPFLLQDTDYVYVTEKIHGCNARYLHHEGRFYVGSHRVLRGVTEKPWVVKAKAAWLRVKRALGMKVPDYDLAFEGKDVWWEIAKTYDLQAKLQQYPGIVLYGEIYGAKVQDLVYDAEPGTRAFRAFDAYSVPAKRWLTQKELRHMLNDLGIPGVPDLAHGEWAAIKFWVETMSEGTTTLGPSGHVREGVVIKTDRPDGTRVAVKYVGQGYLLRKSA